MRFLPCLAACLVLHLPNVTRATEPLFEASFAKGAWNPHQWTIVKSPRWPHVGRWVQTDDHIRNQTPEEATANDPLGPRVREAYTSMVLNRKFRESVSIRAVMSFDDRMAPLIVLAPSLGEDEDGRPEYREHFEIVFWDKGVNVWHHQYEDGKPSWKLAAYGRFKLKAKTRYEVMVNYARKDKGKTLSVLVDGHEFGFRDDSLPDEFHVGLTGCEGINRFYDIAVTKP